MSTNNNQVDGFSVAEKSGGNLIVGKMLKFTIDSKYKVDKADILPDNTTLVAIDVTTAWLNWDGNKPIEHRITQPARCILIARIFLIRMRPLGKLASMVSPLIRGGTLATCG
jgi:hypothetical protein